jgi:P-type Cu+ transporter
MNPADIAVVAGGLALTGLLGWFFFGPKKAHSATQVGNVQEVTVTVKGGYSPDLVRVREGVPLRIVFDRQESGECTSRVVFPDFALNSSLFAYSQTTVELLPDRAGEFGFACGMNMIHGKLIVEPQANGHGGAAPVARENDPPRPDPDRAKEPDQLTEDHEMAERKAEIRADGDPGRAILAAGRRLRQAAGHKAPLGRFRSQGRSTCLQNSCSANRATPAHWEG